MKILKCMYHSEESGMTAEQILPYTEDMIQWAKENAVNGEYTIEDDGIKVVEEPTWQDRIEAQVTYTALITDSLLPEEKEEI